MARISTLQQVELTNVRGTCQAQEAMGSLLPARLSHFDQQPYRVIPQYSKEGILKASQHPFVRQLQDNVRQAVITTSTVVAGHSDVPEQQLEGVIRRCRLNP